MPEQSEHAPSTVLVSTSSFGVHSDAPLHALRAAGYTVRLNPHGRKLSEEEAKELYADCIGVVAGTENVSAAVLETAPNLKAISRVGVGTDAIDFNATKRANIKVVNTPTSHVDAVAELCLGGILDLLRHISASDRLIRAGHWKKPMGRLFAGKTLGLVGFGRVAQRLAELSKAFGGDILATDLAPNRQRADELGVTLASLDEVLQRADIVSLHVPATPKTMGLIGSSQFEQMKPDAILVNAARGGIVDEDALLKHLQQAEGFSAYLDTFSQEPYRGPLASQERLLLTSHIGSYAVESRVEMEAEAVANLLRALSE